MTQELVYDFAVDSLFRGLGPTLTPPLREEVKRCGIDLDRRLLPAYPKDVWIQVVEVVAQHLTPPGGDVSATKRRLGHTITDGFARSTLGTLMAPAVRLAGVRAVMLRLPRTLTMSNNFLEVTVAEVGPTQLKVTVSEAVPSAEFLVGIVEAIAEYVKARSFAVSAQQPRPPEVELLLRWGV